MDQKHPICTKQKIFYKSINITLMHHLGLYKINIQNKITWSFTNSLYKIKKKLREDPKLKELSVSGAKLPIRPKPKFFKKYNYYNLHVHLGPFHCVKFKSKSLEQMQSYDDVSLADPGFYKLA